MASSSSITVANNDSQVLTTFHPFPKLPKELRLMIWELLLPGPRIVDLKILRREVRMGDWLRDWDDMIGGPRPGNIKYRPEDFDVRNYPLPFTQGGSPINKWHETWTVKAEKGPVVLYVNRESQAVGMKVYDKTFRCVGMKAVTWFSYEQDTLYLSSETIHNVLRQKELEKVVGSGILGIDFSRIRKLILGTAAYECPHGFTRYERLCKIISWFGNVKYLTLASELAGSDARDTLIDISSINELMAISRLYRGGYGKGQDLNLQNLIADTSSRNEALLVRDHRCVSDQRKFWENNNKSPKSLWNWELPIIDRQSIVPAKFNAAFYDEVEKYKRQKTLYTIGVNLTVWGGEVFRFMASETSTVRDMIETFRKARRYSKKRVITIEHEGKTLDPETIVLTLENMDTCRILFLNVVLGRT